MRAKFSIRSFNYFGASLFSTQKFRGHVTLATPPLLAFLRGHDGKQHDLLLKIFLHHKMVETNKKH